MEEYFLDGFGLGESERRMTAGDGNEDRKTPGLLVFVPSLNWKKHKGEEFLARLRADPDFESWDIKVFNHRIRTFSRARIEDVALDLAVQVRLWSGEDGGNEAWPQRIILVGYSIGGILAREALMLDSRRSDRRLIDPNVPRWTERVSRVVLIASPNAGYELQRLSFAERAFVGVFSLLGAFLLTHLQDGSDYITNLRLRWFQFIKDADPDAAINAEMRVVQVLGQNDKLISRDKILDADFMRNAATVDIRDAGHNDILNLSQALDPDERFRRLRDALLTEIPTFGDVQEESSEPVVFILHGIRSSKNADWVGSLERIIKSSSSNNAALFQSAGWSRAKTVTPTYGYFGSIHFVNPWIRRSNARKLLQWYGQKYVSHSPNNFYFVGHSNGTFMLGRCLENIPSMRFRRVYLAASVLPKEYPWGHIMRRQQIGHFDDAGHWVIGAIHSDKGRRDVPVGWLCSILHGIEISIPRQPRTADIGTGGFEGFHELESAETEHRYEGGHGDMLVPVGNKAQRNARMGTRLQEIADFIRYNAQHNAPETSDAPFFAWISRLLGTASKIPYLLLLGVVIAAISLGAPQMLVLGAAALYVITVVVNTF